MIPLKHTFRSLTYPNFRRFWFAFFLSMIGTWMQNLALSWLVFRLTRSPFYLGLVTSIGFLPILFFSLLGGALADRIPKKRLILVTQSAMALQALILAILTLTETINIWHILLLSGFLGLANAIDIPTRQAMIVELVEKEALTNAIMLNASLFNSSRIIGPAIAGILVPFIGEGGVFLLNTSSYFVAVFLIFFIQIPFPIREERRPSLWKNLVEGFVYARKSYSILVLLSIVAMSSIFGVSYTVLLPVFAREILGTGSEGLGILMSAAGFGAVAGTLRLATKKGRIKFSSIFLRGIVYSSFLILFSLSRNIFLSVLFLFGVGWGMTTQFASANSFIQETVTDEMRGRIMGLFTLTLMGVQPVGSFFIGYFAQHINTQTAVITFAAIVGLYNFFLRIKVRESQRLST